MIRWEILSSEDKDFVLAEAVNRGWAENRVQVRKYSAKSREIWTIEPYEGDCGCKNLVKFEDYLKENPNLDQNRP